MSAIAGRLAIPFTTGILVGIGETLTGETAPVVVNIFGDNLDIVVAHAGAITFRLTVPGRAVRIVETWQPLQPIWLNSASPACTSRVIRPRAGALARCAGSGEASTVATPTAIEAAITR